MLFAPIIKRFIGPVAVIGIAASALAGCSADTSAFNVGGCLSADSIRQGDCTPSGVDPVDYSDAGLSCNHPYGVTFWPGDWGVDKEEVAAYDPSKTKQRWYCTNPSEAY